MGSRQRTRTATPSPVARPGHKHQEGVDTLTRLGQILDVAVRYDLIGHNPVKTKVQKLKEEEPKRLRLSGEQVRVLLQVAGRNRALLATGNLIGHHWAPTRLRARIRHNRMDLKTLPRSPKTCP